LNHFVDGLGVRPISIDSFYQVKDLLSHLYQQGLRHDHPGSTKIKIPWYAGRRKHKQDRPVSLKPDEYFEELYDCRLSTVRKKKSYKYSR
jgi:hypothetical protein